MKRIDPELTRRARELRNNATPAERTIWRHLSPYRPPFTRQLVVAPYILDLACREARLAVEFDGGQHVDNAYDVGRTRELEAQGWTVIRFWNNEVAGNPIGVAEAILAKAVECLGETHPHGEGEPAPRQVQRCPGDSAAFSMLTSRAGRKRVPRSRTPIPEEGGAGGG